MPESAYKHCHRCGEDRPLDDFNRHRGNKDGRQGYCRPCQNSFYQRDAPLISCGCGCGELIPSVTCSGKPARYKAGHSGRQFVYTVEDRGHITPCWVFSNGDSIDGEGYGRVKRDGKTHQAHRMLYEQMVGPIPEGLFLDHLCGVRRCVNPDHLEPVSPAENTRRGRNAKLTVDQVREIRTAAEIELQERQALGYKRRSPGWQDYMAARYGVVRDTIKQIVRGTVWADV